MRQHVRWRGMFTQVINMMGNFTHHRYYAWPILMLRLHSLLARFRLPRYPRRHIQRPRICHGAIRPCLGALNGLSYPFNSIHGWPNRLFGRRRPGLLLLFCIPAYGSIKSIFYTPLCNVTWLIPLSSLMGAIEGI